MSPILEAQAAAEIAEELKSRLPEMRLVLCMAV